LVSVRQLPGTHPRVHARELDALVAKHTRPAGDRPAVQPVAAEVS
jgi:hypothetical protein